ncbi:HigA family addiction module antidote protein [Methylovulum psychrotolerans]|uniref:HigA family addiction module antitoxin n=1 Tax=Methylovulum psychrotolerans TaxID=1704499 RepID=UPI001BFF35FB|nr:HigA family addiction module antitoxin [Methylovulum psychrotolerans]MBT9099415.1 HigA family addiction module antidote protein [Methylovulum psychrotolerans]
MIYGKPGKNYGYHSAVRLHPYRSEILHEDVLLALGLTTAEAAKQLGVTPAALSRVLNGKAALSPEMALRLESWLGIETTVAGQIWISQPPLMTLGKRVWPSTVRLASVPKLTAE